MVTITNLNQTAFEPLSQTEAATVSGGVALPETLSQEESTASSIGNVVTSDTKNKSQNKSQQWSSSLQSLLDQPPSSLPLRLMIGGIAFCSIFGAWAWFGRIQDVSYAQGRLVPQGEVYKVQPIDPGEVARITVREGKSIKAGQVIAELDDRLAQAEVDRLKQSLTALQFERMQKQGLIERIQLEIKSRQSIAAAEAQAQEAAIAEVYTKAEISRKTIQELQSELAAHQVRLDRLQPLVETGALAQDHLFDAEASIREYQRNMTQTQGELQNALTQEKQFRAQLTQKRAEGQTNQLQAQQQLQQLKIDVSQLDAKIQETQNLLKTAQAKLGQLYLRAPIDGVISSLKVHNAGEVLQPGQTLAEIAPKQAPLVLSAVLPSGQAGFVRVGMPVQMKFDAFPYQDYGVVPGRVISVSPDSQVDEQLGTVYRVNIKLDRKFITHEQQEVYLKAGQTAKAEIVTRQRRIIDVLIEPIKRLQAGGISL
ncbi:MAG TPA: HlyD family efflux transporter periplasmic adaptor subunit [Trichocoleus sp.]|jgi:HlyD family type I secretion membrane fusion protein